MYSLCSQQTYIMYIIKYLAITIYFSVMSNKLLPYHIIMVIYLLLCTIYIIIKRNIMLMAIL